MSGISRVASPIETPCLFRQLWASRRKRNMITTLHRGFLAALVAFVAGSGWNLLADPKADGKAATNSGSAVSSDSYMGLTGEELWSNNCGRCHNIQPPTRYNNAQWDVIVHHMRLRANITGQEQRAIVEFLKSAK